MPKTVEIEYTAEKRVLATIILTDAEWIEYQDWLEGAETPGDLVEFLMSSGDYHHYWLARRVGEDMPLWEDFELRTAKVTG